MVPKIRSSSGESRILCIASLGKVKKDMGHETVERVFWDVLILDRLVATCFARGPVDMVEYPGLQQVVVSLIDGLSTLFPPTRNLKRHATTQNKLR